MLIFVKLWNLSSMNKTFILFINKKIFVLLKKILDQWYVLELNNDGEKKLSNSKACVFSTNLLRSMYD